MWEELRRGQAASRFESGPQSVQAARVESFAAYPATRASMASIRHARRAASPEHKKRYERDRGPLWVDYEEMPGGDLRRANTWLGEQWGNYFGSYLGGGRYDQGSYDRGPGPYLNFGIQDFPLRPSIGERVSVDQSLSTGINTNRPTSPEPNGYTGPSGMWRPYWNSAEAAASGNYQELWEAHEQHRSDSTEKPGPM